MDEALFFRLGRAVIPALGILNGVNSFIIWSNSYSCFRSPKNTMHG
ncbi:Hypothetical protein NATL1_12601 [Prochlorococcus marinus str. NATL1A]|uniref:Uncharacterized protein n=1 Tax=Prochlorococcus marinus (strain NATL1A) TaxID=167555 RepID=A2C2V8_PROM1|nr:Hypothetical protein NATL1_12601 [Prochlorococcus marinus str. NATL1A]